MITGFEILALVFVGTVGYATITKTRAAWILVLSEAIIGFGYFAYSVLLPKL
ncbi:MULTISPECIES: hypothetical protein [Achromobacter]